MTGLRRILSGRLPVREQPRPSTGRGPSRRFGRARTCIRSPCGPNRLRNSAGPSARRTRTSAAPGCRTRRPRRAPAPRRARRASSRSRPESTYSHSYPSWVRGSGPSRRGRAPGPPCTPGGRRAGGSAAGRSSCRARSAWPAPADRRPAGPRPVRPAAPGGRGRSAAAVPGWGAAAGFQPGQRADGDAGRLGERRERHAPLLADPAQPGADPGEYGVQLGVVLVLFLHGPIAESANLFVNRVRVRGGPPADGPFSGRRPRR